MKEIIISLCFSLLFCGIIYFLLNRQIQGLNTKINNLNITLKQIYQNLQYQPQNVTGRQNLSPINEELEENTQINNKILVSDNNDSEEEDDDDSNDSDTETDTDTNSDNDSDSDTDDDTDSDNENENENETQINEVTDTFENGTKVININKSESQESNSEEESKNIELDITKVNDNKDEDEDDEADENTELEPVLLNELKEFQQQNNVNDKIQKSIETLTVPELKKMIVDSNKLTPGEVKQMKKNDLVNYIMNEM